jgi:diadenylate cyclase
MSRLDDDDVLDLRIAASTLHRAGDSRDLDQEVAPKGLRLLHRVHRLAAEKAAVIADHFGGLAKLQRATIADLMAVDDVDEATAVSIKDTLERVTESTILDQYS